MLLWNLNFQHIDNRAVVSLNLNPIYDSGLIDHDPALNINVPFVPVPGENVLRISLYNTDNALPTENPWHLSFTLTDPGGTVVATVNAEMPADASPVISNDRVVLLTGIAFSA